MTVLGFLAMEAIVQPQNWPASVWVLLLTTLGFLIAQTAWRPSFPKNAPALLREGYPILGALRFFSDRNNFHNHGISASKTGNFSFYFGKHQIVGLGGTEGRKTFFESKELSMSEGYAVLFVATPPVPQDAMSGKLPFHKFFARCIIQMMKQEKLMNTLPLLMGDTVDALTRMSARGNAASGSAVDGGIMDPFTDVYEIVYRLTMRIVGADEIARSPELLAKTLKLFEVIEDSSSPARVIFPWLPTPAHIRKMYAGGRLYMIVQKLVDERKKTGRREDDAVQFLMDTGENTVRILSFVLGALFAGQLNSGINAAWLLLYLATDPEWYKRVREEVDGMVEKHRKSAGQSRTDVLASLTIEDWESQFPMIDLSLRETIRFQLVGTAFRKNTSGKDVPIGDAGEVVPKDAFATYLMDDIHFNSEIYTDPYKWDPARYLPDRAEDKKAPLGYLGWGIGRHPCLGMRFAKLEMTIITAVFCALFDWTALEPTSGKPMTVPPKVDRTKHSAHKPAQPVRFKYKLR